MNFVGSSVWEDHSSLPMKRLGDSKRSRNSGAILLSAHRSQTSIRKMIISARIRTSASSGLIDLQYSEDVMSEICSIGPSCTICLPRDRVSPSPPATVVGFSRTNGSGDTGEVNAPASEILQNENVVYKCMCVCIATVRIPITAHFAFEIRA